MKLSIIINKISDLTTSDLKILLNLIKNKIDNSDDELINEFLSIKWPDHVVCVWCKSNNIKKNGLYNNIQRYRCKNCLRSFNFKSNSFLSRTHLTLSQWMLYIKCFLLKMTCHSTANLTNISTWSCWKNRIKLTKFLYKKLENDKLSGTIWLDETFINETYKGNWKKENKHFRLVERQEYEKDNKKKLRGLSRYKLNIMTGTNETNKVFLDVVCFGKLNKESSFRILNEYLVLNDIIITDMEPCYFSYCEQNKIQHLPVKSYSKNRGKILSAIDRVHSRFKNFIRRFKGVSFIYSLLYFSWFKFIDEHRKFSYEIQKIALLNLLMF